MFDLTGKIAIITGAGSGIGKAIALLFARQGAEIGLVDINADQAEATLMEIQAAGGKGFLLVGNVADENEVQRMLEPLEKIDIPN